MLLRSKIWNLTKIIFWLLSVGRVVEGSVNDAQNSLEESKTTSSHSERTTSAQEDAFKRSVKYIEDQGGGGGTTFDDFEEDFEEDDHHLIHHRK